MQTKILLVLAGVILWMTGCATDPGAKLAKHNIKTVGVEPRVNAAVIRYGEILPGQRGNASQALAGLIVDSMKNKSMKRMGTLMQEQKIDVPAMVRSNFVQAVNQIGYEYSENGPDATFVLELEQHGFDQRTVFSNKVAPFAVVRAKLVKADGKVIWRGNSQDGQDFWAGKAANSMEESRKQIGVKEWDEYERTPEKLRADWEIVVKDAVGDLLRAAQKKQ
jgi:hypothetical protein